VEHPIGMTRILAAYATAVGAAPETRLLLAARGIRAIGDGFVSLLLPVYLLELGYGPFEIGVIATATLAGSAFLTLLVGLYAHRASGRSLLIGATILMMLTGISFATFEELWPLLLVAFVGTLNPSSGDVSVFLPLEQAQLARLVSDRGRTSLFARYSFIGSIMAAVGSLGAALPEAAAELSGLELRPTLQAAFLVYAALGGLALLLYRRLPQAAGPADPDQPSPKPLGRSRGIVLTLAVLFSLDAFAGGLVVQSLLALWLFERFGLSLAAAGAIFFWTGVLSALSYFAAAGSRTGSGSSTQWCSRTCRRIFALRSSPSPRACRSRSRCCSFAARSHRWTCPPGPRTSWRWSRPRSGRRPPA
jgi:MFS family permease